MAARKKKPWNADLKMPGLLDEPATVPKATEAKVLATASTGLVFSPRPLPVVDRFPLKSRGGWVLVIHERAKRGDTIHVGGRTWTIEGVETFCILNPPLPWGFLVTGGDAPEVGALVTIERGPHHETTPWPMSEIPQLPPQPTEE